MKTKKLLVLLMTLVFALLLVACGNDTPDPTPTNNGEKIDFGDTMTKPSVLRIWMDDEKGEYMEELIAAFNKIYPNIVVEHQHKGTVDAREHLKTFGPSGNGADIFQFPHDHLAQAVLEDLLLPLPESTKTLVNERSHQLGKDIATMHYDPVSGSFDPDNPNTVETLYAMPVSVESVGLYYNKKLVDTPVTTYEELLDFAATWNAKQVSATDTRTNADAGYYGLGTSSHWADSYFIQHIYSAFGFTPFGPNLNDPSAVGFNKLNDALEWMKTELKPVTTGTGNHDSASAGANFENGLIPYIIAGPWNNEAYKAKNLDYGIAPLPTINGKETQSFAGAMMTGVYKYSKNQADAIKFLEFLNTDEAMEIQYRLKNKLPALKPELLENVQGVLQDELMIAMSEQLETSVPMPTIPQVTYYWGPGEELVKEIWNQNKDIAAAVAEAEKSYRDLANLAS